MFNRRWSFCQQVVTVEDYIDSTLGNIRDKCAVTDFQMEYSWTDVHELPFTITASSVEILRHRRIKDTQAIYAAHNLRIQFATPTFDCRRFVPSWNYPFN